MRSVKEIFDKSSQLLSFIEQIRAAIQLRLAIAAVAQGLEIRRVRQYTFRSCQKTQMVHRIIIVEHTITSQMDPPTVFPDA